MSTSIDFIIFMNKEFLHLKQYFSISFLFYFIQLFVNDKQNKKMLNETI
jgi:hypothetical protein